MKKTPRGFSYKEFKDESGAICSIQKSSIATKDLIWLGFKYIDMKGFYPYTQEPWRNITDEQIKQAFGCADLSSNTRMHLSRSQVKKLLPFLQKFAETGELE